MPNGTSQIDYSYDANGNTVEVRSSNNEARSFAYDNKNQLVKVQKSNGDTIEYVYDGNGNRYSKTVNGQTRYYSYDTSGNIVSEYKRVMVNGVEKSQTLVRYVRDTGGKAISMIQYDYSGQPSTVIGQRVYYFIYNGHGDVTSLTDASGTVAATYSYDEFGNEVIGSRSSDNEQGIYNPLRYSGAHNAYYDNETASASSAQDGLYKMGTRYYQPDVGRWLTRDKYEGEQVATQSLNRYVYALNNPTNLVDPSGFVAKKITIDPGHGGSKPGAVVPSQYVSAYKAKYEKTINRRVAYWLRAYLRSKGYSVNLTRSVTKDQGVENKQRPEKAKGSDAFVSIHQNSWTGSSQQGAEVYYNSSNKKGSNRLASITQSKLVSLGLINRGVKTGNELTVLNGYNLKIPSILVETGFITANSNSRDFQLLTKKSGRKQIGDAIGRAIDEFF